MKFKFLAGTLAMVLSFLGIENLPINAEKNEVDFDAEQAEKLKKQMGDDIYQKMVGSFNKELKDMQSNNLDLKAIEDELAALRKASAVQEDLEANGQSENLTAAENLKLINEALAKQNVLLKEKEELIQKLMKEDLEIPTLQIGKGNATHSATHLFASGQKYDAIENRPWNARAVGRSMQVTDFNNDSYIPLLQDDLKHFVRQNPTMVQDLFDDKEELPAEWSRISGVQDRIATGYVQAGEIAQARSKGWAPKGKFQFDVEENRVFRKKIDITFEGYELQEIENTWIGMLNRDGSKAYKMSFVSYLLTIIIQQEKLDSRKAHINGIYVTPAGGSTPGTAVNSQNGILWSYWKNREIEKKIKPFVSTLGEPTKANIVEYVREFIESLPEEHRNQSGLELQLSIAMLQDYRKAAGEIYVLNRTPDQGNKEYNLSYPVDYPNIKFQPLKDMTKTKFMAITYSKNNLILEYRPEEKYQFFTEQKTRQINILSDYREGAGHIFVGTKSTESSFEKQMIWTNNLPIWDDSVMPTIFDDTTGILKLNYKNVKVASTWNTDITDLEASEFFKTLPAGLVVKITGDTTLVAAKKVKHNTAKLVLAGNADFNLQSGGTLTLIKQADGKFRELERTAGPVSVTADAVNFTGDTIDSNDGVVFNFTGGTATTLAEITNGYEGNTIRIYGSTTALTVSNVTGEISVTANAVLNTTEKFIELTFINGKWFEVQRSV